MKTYPQLADLHMHSTYSDGCGSLEDMVKSAIEKGVNTIALTDHNPLPFPDTCAMAYEKLADYREEIYELQEHYAEKIQILLGIEADYLRMYPEESAATMAMDWEHCIGSVHFFSFGKEGVPVIIDASEDFHNALQEYSILRLCEDYFLSIQHMVATCRPHAIGHFDLIKKFNSNERYFSESESWYRDLVLETLDSVQKSGISLEINTAGRDKPCAEQYPSRWIIEECRKRTIPLLLSSDSHSPDTIGRYFSEYTQYLS